MHTEGVAFTPHKSPRARCAYSNILAQVLNQSVVYLERRVESLAVCMPHLNNTCANCYVKYLTLNAGRQRFRCAWALTLHVRAATDESQKTLNKCETRNKTVFYTRLRHPETINSVPLSYVCFVKQVPGVLQPNMLFSVGESRRSRNRLACLDTVCSLNT